MNGTQMVVALTLLSGLIVNLKSMPASIAEFQSQLSTFHVRHEPGRNGMAHFFDGTGILAFTDPYDERII